ncbi:MAG: hypothetical protein GC191_02055 [Azospirillum sp.]|nr:hypothetical protein [Azospirillum sp.]
MTIGLARAGAAGVAILGCLLVVTTDFAEGNVRPPTAPDKAVAKALLQDFAGRKLGSAQVFGAPVGTLLKLEMAQVPSGFYTVELVRSGSCSSVVADAAAGVVPLSGVHAGADGQVRADLLTDEVSVAGDDDGLFQDNRTPLLVLAAASDADSAGVPPAPLACGSFAR